ncbi:retrotransposon protein, putative, ty1-copia subclass [Tanacetum coccineum]
MLLTMDLDIQRNLSHLGAYDMLQELKSMFSKQAEQELLQSVREFHACKQEEGQYVRSYVLKMKSYIDNLERLGQPVSQNLATVNELHAMLKLHEDTLPKKDSNPALHAIRVGRVQKNQKNKPHKAAKGGHGKVKSKMSYAPNNAPFAPKPKTHPPPKKKNPGLRGSKKLKPGALSLYVGDGHPAAVEAIGTYHFELPSGLVIVLNNCHYAPYITKGVILVSHLFDDGFINRFDENNVISVSKNNLVYFMAVPRDGIFEIDMSCSNTNDSSMYAISNKRAKTNLDSSLLWHCRLGHISKKRIEKLQHDGLINSIDIESLGKCVSCLSGKMARKPYSHQVERAKDLLGLIHTDVCGPFRIVSRQGASYFVTFTDDFSRYGYVYLLKHKHEVFETFKSFWDYALETAAHILNMVPTKKVDKTPYEIWHGQAPKLSYLRVWGCEAFVKHDTLTKPDKLDPRSFKSIFIGYPKETMGYSFYSPSENKVFVARNAEFFESKLLDLKASGSVEDLEVIQEEDTNPSVDTSLNHEEDDQEIDEPQSDINPIRRSTRTRRPTDRLCLYIDAEEHELGDLNNDVWVLVELPPNSRTVGSKWLFKKKTDIDGAVYVFKAHLVAKGFTQTYGVNYEETFSPVADLKAIRIFIAIAAYYDYEIWQMDVKTAFPNGHLSEEVYMEQPEGFVNLKYPNHVCKRSIYGLKQASRQWNKRFDDEIKKFGFTQNPDKPCVYQKASGSYVAILILYVDDILLMGNNIPMSQDIKSYLGRSFAMKDLGDAAYIFGIKIYCDRYYMENSKRGTIPMQEKLKLSKSQSASTPAEKQRMQNVPYALAIGSIMYAVRCTRPDVAFAQNITSRFQQNPGNMERELRVSCYTDAGYLTDADDLRSQTGYVFVLNGGDVNWKSTKQSIFATPSTDAEYIAAFDASKEVVWICKFIYGLGIVPTIEEPISMYYDNTRVITIAKDDGVTKGARHFGTKVHYLRETIKLGDVKMENVDTDDNLADPFTKALAFPKHSELTRNIEMLSARPSTPPSYSPGPSTPQNYSSRPSRNAECSNCKHLLGKITVLEAIVEMYMHPEQYTLNSTALHHEVYNDMGKLGLE